MPVAVICTSCSARLVAPDSLNGKKVTCPTCQSTVAVPDPANADAAGVVKVATPPIRVVVAKPIKPEPTNPALKDIEAGDRSRKRKSAHDDGALDRSVSPKSRRTSPREKDDLGEKPRKSATGDADRDDRPRRKKKPTGKKSILPLVLVGGGIAGATVVAAVVFLFVKSGQTTPTDPEGNGKRPALASIPLPAPGPAAVPGQPPAPAAVGLNAPAVIAGVSVQVGGAWINQDEDEVWVSIAIETNDPARKYDYQSWELLDGNPPARLGDDAGNTYHLREHNPLRTAVLRASLKAKYGESTEFGPGTVYRGKARMDILVFDRPVDGCKTLTLELDADRVGVAGAFRFAIPRNAAATGAFALPPPPSIANKGRPAKLIVPTGQQYCRIMNKNSGLALEVVDASKDTGARLTQGRYEGKPHQEWEVVRTENLRGVRIRNRNSGLVAAVPSGERSRGALMIQDRPSADAGNDVWTMLRSRDQHFRIWSGYSRLYLSVAEGGKTPGAQVIQWQQSGGDEQLWELVEVTAEPNK